MTYGNDDDYDGKQIKVPWPKEVGDLLGCNVVNYGVPSATVLDIDSWTPVAWSKAYDRLSKNVDILGIMLGINDCYRNYPLGTPRDREDSTFYGGLNALD